VVDRFHPNIIQIYIKRTETWLRK